MTTVGPAAVPPIAVVGASLAGLSAAQALIESDAVGTVTVFGAEAHLPYDRPPLSKGVLRGVLPVEACALDLGDDPRLTWRVATPVVGFDAAALRLTLADGSTEHFAGGVVIATGAAPRVPAWGVLEGIHVLRSLDDSSRLRDALRNRPAAVVVVGGGFIGTEVAAACVEAGLEVTVIESLDHPFQFSLGAEVGDALMAEHRARGVHVHTGVSVVDVRGTDRARSVLLSDGSEIPADVVVLGLGVVPNTGWLAGSGLAVADGVECDETLRAAPGVVAAGDVARWPNPRFGESRRVEHWDNAIRQGRHAASRLLAEHGYGRPEPFAAVPWVWSDQYDNKIQLVGSTLNFEEVIIAHGSVQERRFVALYRRGEHLVAAAGFNQPRLVTRYRRKLAGAVLWQDALAGTGAAQAAAGGDR